MSEAFGWIGVDLDGTLAYYDGWHGSEHIGQPIPAMVDRVKAWLAEGKDVRIVTARVYAPLNDITRQREAALSLLTIAAWCKEHIGEELPVTYAKDFGLIELWDDRAVQVEINTGRRIDENPA